MDVSPTSPSNNQPCPCGGVGYVPGERGYVPCPCQLERRIARELPERFRQARLADFTPAVIQTVRAWLSNPKEGLLFTGPVGAGKTHLAAAIVRERFETNRKATFRRFADFYAEIRECFSGKTDTSEREILRPYLEDPFLVVDDLGSGSLSDFERRAALEVIDQRSNYCRPMVLTTNWSLKQIADRMDDRIASRLAPFKIIELRGQDRRVKEVKHR